jgi:hypothetical protein
MEFVTLGRELWTAGALFQKVRQWLNRGHSSMSLDGQSATTEQGGDAAEGGKPDPELVRPTGSRRCCDEDSCIRKDIAHIVDPDSPITDRIYVAAAAVARTCGSLNAEELHVCASRLFDVPAECDLANTFLIAYQTERDVIAGLHDIEKKRAAGLL